MSRGGRGGFGGGASRAGVIGGKDFEIEADLEDQINAYQNEIGDNEDEWLKTLFPSTRTLLAPPTTEREKKLVAAWRTHRTAMRNGPLFMDGPSNGKRDLSEFDAFNDQATYGNKRLKQSGGMPNLKKVPIVKSLLPRELQDLVSDDEEDEASEAPKKNLDFLKKKKIDKLARFDDEADEGADKEDDDEPKDNEDGGEDEVEELVDDDFSEDDDDLGNDYNAEQYFDNGDDMEDEGEGEGGEDACEGKDTADMLRIERAYKAEQKRWEERNARGRNASSRNAFCPRTVAAEGADFMMERLLKARRTAQEEEDDEEDDEKPVCVRELRQDLAREARQARYARFRRDV